MSEYDQVSQGVTHSITFVALTLTGVTIHPDAQLVSWIRSNLSYGLELILRRCSPGAEMHECPLQNLARSRAAAFGGSRGTTKSHRNPEGTEDAVISHSSAAEGSKHTVRGL